MISKSSDSAIKEEGLTIVKKPCPGLNVFDGSNCLRCFSIETLLEKHLRSIHTEHFYVDLVCSLLHHVVGFVEPVKLFYLMSVCPEEEVVKACLSCWQHNKHCTISVCDVILVFLNWGASPESLRIHDDSRYSSCSAAITLPPTRLPSFPAPHNVKAVLDAISDCPSDEASDEADEQRTTLLKFLITASLDEGFFQYRFEFQQTICKILETFSVWNKEKVTVLVERLDLLQLGLQNAAYVCCSLTTISPRGLTFKVTAVRYLLHSRFDLLPPEEPFHCLLENLPPADQITDRFQLVEVYVLMQLMNTLLIICSLRPKNESDACANIAEIIVHMSLIERLRNWADSVHSELMIPKFVYTIEGSFVREKCVRLRADCVELICVLRNDMKEWQTD